MMGPVAKQNALLERALTLLEPVPPAVEATPNIAKVWGEKLTDLNPRQRLFAEKAINDVLFEAGLGNLHKDSVKINVSSSIASQHSSAHSTASDENSYSLADFYSSYS